MWVKIVQSVPSSTAETCIKFKERTLSLLICIRPIRFIIIWWGYPMEGHSMVFCFFGVHCWYIWCRFEQPYYASSSSTFNQGEIVATSFVRIYGIGLQFHMADGLSLGARNGSFQDRYTPHATTELFGDSSCAPVRNCRRTNSLLPAE
jgi:hypothetical protein